MSKKNKYAKRAKLIANPGSGDASDRGVLIEQVTRTLMDLGVKLDVAIAKPKEMAIPIAKKAVKQGYKTIIAMGGDDTVEAIIRGIAGSKTHLGIIPVGTANDLAKGLGIPEDPQQACKLIADGNIRKLDLGRVKVKKGKKLHFFELVMVGIGAAIYPEALKVRKGRLADVKELVTKALSHETTPSITTVMDGDSKVKVKTMLAIVSNVPLIGPNMMVDPHISSDDGLFDISLYPNFSKTELITYFTKTMNEHSVEDGKIQRYRAKNIKIKTSPKLDVMADGVMLGKGNVKIKMLHGALRMIAPEVGTGAEKPTVETGADLPAPVAPVITDQKTDEVPVKEA